MNRAVVIGLLAGVAGLACASSAFAANADSMVGNTSVCTAPDGAATKVFQPSAGRFVLTLPNGQSITGDYVDDGSQICFTERNPAPPAGTAPVCTPSVERKVGDTWTVDARGVTQSCVLAAGQQ